MVVIPLDAVKVPPDSEKLPAIFRAAADPLNVDVPPWL